MSRRYPRELIEYAKTIVENRSNQDVAEMINEKYGTEFNARNMNSFLKNHKIRRKQKASRKQEESELWPKAVREYVAAVHEGVSIKEMPEMIKKATGLEYTYEQVRAYYKRYKIHSNYDARFRPGQASYNKGVPMAPEVYEKAKATMFQKGDMPHNHVEIGTIVLATVGYYKVKVAEPDQWEFCHVKAWREANGEIPEGKMISFKDGNVANWDLSNLILLSREENAYMNMMGLRFENPEFTEVGANIARVMMKAKERSK